MSMRDILFIGGGVAIGLAVGYAIYVSKMIRTFLK